MEIAVYYNRKGPGYDFHKKTGGVTKSHEREIKQFAPNDDYGHVNFDKGVKVCMRFSGMEDGKTWLLSYIFHNLSHEGERMSNAIVSYILNAGEADRLFESPYAEFSRWERLSQDLIDSREKSDLNAAAHDFFRKSNSVAGTGRYKLNDEWEKLSLYVGALYPNGKTQIYMVGVDDKQDMAWLFASLPGRLRKRVSFCVNAMDVKETTDASLIFCSDENWWKMVNQSGGKQVQKIDYRNPPPGFGEQCQYFLKDERAMQYAAVYADILAVDDWETYLSYIDALLQNKIDEILGREGIRKILNSGDNHEAVDYLWENFGDGKVRTNRRKGRQSRADDEYSGGKAEHSRADDEYSGGRAEHSRADDESDGDADEYGEYDQGFPFLLFPSRWPALLQKLGCVVIAALLCVCLFKFFPFRMDSESVVYYISVGAVPTQDERSAGGFGTSQDADNAGGSGTSQDADNADNSETSPGADNAGGSGTSQSADAAGNFGTSQDADNADNSETSPGADNAGGSGTSQSADAAGNFGTSQDEDGGLSDYTENNPPVLVSASVHTLRIDGKSVFVWLNGIFMASLLWALVLIIRKFLSL